MRFLFSIITIFCILSMHAQDNKRIVQLGDVEVVSHRKLKDAGIEKTVLDTMVLRENISLSMADILSKNSTLFIKSYGRATEATAEFRGTSPSHTQVTWNGMKINSPMFGTVDFSTIPAYFIDEANLYHGASSLNISGGGLGGAVEMVSKPVTTDGFHAQYVQGIGSFHTYDQFLRLMYRHGRWTSSTRAVFSTSKNDFRYTNYDKKTDVYDDAGNLTGSYHPEETNKSGYFDDVHVMQEIGYDATKSDKLNLAVWYSYSKRGLPFLSVDYKDDSDFTNETKKSTIRSIVSWNHHKADWTMTVRAGHSYSDIAYDYFTKRADVQTDITHSQSYTNTVFAQGNADWNITSQLLLTGGVSIYYNHVKSADRSPFHIGENFNQGRADTDANLQLRWRPLDRLTLSGIVREEAHGTKWLAPIPALFTDFILYKPLNLVLKASVARNYRYPSMDDLYFQPGGNPELQPEKGIAVDGGIEMSVRRKAWMVKGNISAFDSHITDWILWTPNVKGFWEPSNVKKVHNYGIEAMLNTEFMLARDLKLAVAGNYAWTPSKNLGEQLNADDESYGKQLCYVPEYSANINGRIAWRSWTLSYQWTYYSERYTTSSNDVGYIIGRLIPYYNSDMSIERTFQLKNVSLSVKAAVNNLLSAEYATVLSHPLPRRNYELYFTIKL